MRIDRLFSFLFSILHNKWWSCASPINRPDTLRLLVFTFISLVGLFWPSCSALPSSPLVRQSCSYRCRVFANLMRRDWRRFSIKHWTKKKEKERKNERKGTRNWRLEKKEEREGEKANRWPVLGSRLRAAHLNTHTIHLQIGGYLILAALLWPHRRSGRKIGKKVNCLSHNSREFLLCLVDFENIFARLSL